MRTGFHRARTSVHSLWQWMRNRTLTSRSSSPRALILPDSPVPVAPSQGANTDPASQTNVWVLTFSQPDSQTQCPCGQGLPLNRPTLTGGRGGKGKDNITGKGLP